MITVPSTPGPTPAMRAALGAHIERTNRYHAELAFLVPEHIRAHRYATGGGVAPPVGEYSLADMLQAHREHRDALLLWAETAAIGSTWESAETFTHGTGQGASEVRIQRVA